jgi:hypothetical protein
MTHNDKDTSIPLSAGDEAHVRCATPDEQRRLGLLANPWVVELQRAGCVIEVLPAIGTTLMVENSPS